MAANRDPPWQVFSTQQDNDIPSRGTVFIVFRATSIGTITTTITATAIATAAAPAAAPATATATTTATPRPAAPPCK